MAITKKLPLIKCNQGVTTKDFCAINGDCIEVVKQLPDQSIDFCIYSPPFSNLFTYSDSERDMGNNADDEEFFSHYLFLIKDMLRVMKPGRNVAVHISDVPFTKWKDGVIGLNDLPGKVSDAHTKAGWILHSKVTIWKDPVVEMQRTKALGLLYMQLRKDSARSRMGMADYLYIFKAPGDNPEPIGHEREDFSLDQWQEWASPVWMDIRQTNTLNVQAARDQRDDKHIAPLQLDLIERALILWSNPGDIVLSPFMGIGSEGYVSLRQKRKFVGVELKDSYYRVACKNLHHAKDSAASFFES